MGATAALVAFTAITAGAQIVKGIQENAAYREQGQAMQRQAEIARQESEYAAKQKKREVDKAAARQVMAFTANGINTSSGSPLEILQETLTLGQDEVDAIKRQGAAQVDYYNSQARVAYKSGRSALLGGITGAATTVVTAFAGGAAGSAGKGLLSFGKGTATGVTPSIASTASSSGQGVLGTLPSL